MSLNTLNDTIGQPCAILDALGLIGGRYKLLILRAMLFAGEPIRFGQLQRAVQVVSQKTLTRNLRELEASGILTRKVYAEVPPRVEYDLSENGKALMPVFAALKNWRETDHSD